VTLLSAGNLSLTQSAVSLIREWASEGQEGRDIYRAPSMYRVARIVGEALREVHRLDGEALRKFDTEFNASFLVGGQVKGDDHRLFNVYAAGNFIEATAETPFFQLGETKYGKPVLDRLLTPAMQLDQAIKLVLISFDSTMRSNLSVGPPIHVLTYKRNKLVAEKPLVLGEGDGYLLEMRRRWGDGLRAVFEELPPPALPDRVRRE
jgi:putative proteasome-type protease